MRILALALLLISIFPCAWTGSNSTYSNRAVPRWGSGAKGRRAGGRNPYAQPNSPAAHGQIAKGAIARHPVPRKALPTNRPRPPTGPPARICRGCR